MDADPYFTEEGDLENAREVIASGAPVELFLYPGDQHYFADSSLPTYDPRLRSFSPAGCSRSSPTAERPPALIWAHADQ